jgi:hypothetical protein
MRLIALIALASSFSLARVANGAESPLTSYQFDLGVAMGSFGAGRQATLGLSQSAGAIARWVLEGGIGPRHVQPAYLTAMFVDRLAQNAFRAPTPLIFGLTGIELRGGAVGGPQSFVRAELGAGAAREGEPHGFEFGRAPNEGAGRTTVSAALSVAAGFRGPSLGRRPTPCVTVRALWLPAFTSGSWFGSMSFGAGW